MTVPAGIHGGVSSLLITTEELRKVKLTFPFGETNYCDLRTRVTSESRSLTGEIGVVCAEITPNIVSSEWTISEDVEFVYAPARSGASMIATVKKPLLKVVVLAIRLKRTTGTFSLGYNAMSDTTGIPVDLRVNDATPFSVTTQTYTFSSVKPAPKASITIPIGTIIAYKSQKTSMDGFVVTSYDFEFTESGSIGNIQTHLLLLDNSISDGQGIANFGDTSLANNDGKKYTLRRSFILDGSGKTEANLEQTITVYNSDNYY